MKGDRAAIEGSLAECQMIKTRDVLVLKIEVPLERALEVLNILGFPRPGQEIPVALARLKNPPPKAVRAVDPLGESSLPPPRASFARAELSRRLYASLSPEDRAVRDAGMMAKDRTFQLWLQEGDPKYYVGEAKAAEYIYVGEAEAAEYIRNYSQVTSRTELATDTDARERFIELKARFEKAVGRTAEARG